MAEMKKDFGAFELHEKIGSGGMASVFLGVQKSLDRKVVLKVLHPHLAEDEKLVARFEREARAAAMMRHPNIVQVIDCGRHEDVAYIAMEFVEGMDLKKWMETYGSPPIEVALLLLRDLCSGLEHAHGHRIIHRDIKPANIMFTKDGQVKIMDFGLARSGAENSTQMTMAGSVLGTPAYMSPEQSTGEAVDERSDIFSVGVVGYELLGGQRPFQGESYSTVLRAVLTVDPPSLEQLNPLVPHEIVALVHKMLQKDVTKRYAGIGQARADLEALIDQSGMSRSSTLLREYATDPLAVAATLRKKRLSRHVDQGLYFENMGLGKIDDAVVEFRRALHLDPDNKVAREHFKRLEKERERIRAEQAAGSAPAGSGDSTVVLPPEPAATTRPAKPARVAPAAAPAAPAGSGNGMRNALVGMGVLVALVLAVVALVRFGQKHDDATAPAPAPAPIEAERVPASDATPAPAPAPAAKPAPTETPAPAAAGVAKVAPAPAPATAPATVANGTVVVKAAPFATYYVDDQVQGQPNTMTARLEVEPGTHTIKAVHPSFPPKVWSGVRVTAGGTVRLAVDFLQVLPGTLKVTSEGGWATVLLNGKPTGKTTPAEFADLKPGEYTVTVTREGFTVNEATRTVSVKGGETATVRFALQPK